MAVAGINRGVASVRRVPAKKGAPVMSDQSAYRPSPAHPPAVSREPEWTTGQGIGFLVALPGWILVGLAVLAAFVGAFGTSSDDEFVRLVVGAIVVGGVGLLAALPGTIVFGKCKRR